MMTNDESLAAAKETAATTFDTQIAACLTNLIRSNQLHITAAMKDIGSDEWRDAMIKSVDSLEAATNKLAEALNVLASRTDASGRRWKEAQDAIDARK